MLDRHTMFWIRTGILSAALFGLSLLWLTSGSNQLTLQTINRALADTALVLVSLSLILGPLAKFTAFFDRYVPYRKHLGIWGFGLALLHVDLTFFVMTGRYPWSRYTDWPLSFLAGLTATALLTFLAAITPRWAMQRLGPHRWRVLLRYGSYAALIAILLHVYELKVRFWRLWLADPGDRALPLSLVVATIAALVFAARFVTWVYDLSHPRPKPGPSGEEHAQ